MQVLQWCGTPGGSPFELNTNVQEKVALSWAGGWRMLLGAVGLTQRERLILELDPRNRCSGVTETVQPKN